MTRERALAFATKKHQGQKRRNGDDYITHPIAVADIAIELAKKYNITEEEYLDDLYILTVNHDVLEDTNTTPEEFKETFGEYIYNGVASLSRKVGETYYDFIMRIIDNFSDDGYIDPLVIIAKLADLTHNMSDLEEGSLKDKYRFAYKILSNQLEQL